MGVGSGLSAAHPVLEAFDHRAALTVLARGVLRRASGSGARHWLLVWPGIPEPVLFINARCHAVEDESYAA